MQVKMFEREGLVRFGHFTDTEITRLLGKQWIEVHSWQLESYKPRRKKKRRVTLNKHGIPVYE